MHIPYLSPHTKCASDVTLRLAVLALLETVVTDDADAAGKVHLQPSHLHMHTYTYTFCIHMYTCTSIEIRTHAHTRTLFAYTCTVTGVGT